MEQPGVLTGPITRRSRGSNPAPAIVLRMENIHTLLFYKFITLKNVNEIAEKQKQICDSIGLKGKILLAEEGINGSVSGAQEQVEAYKTEMKKDEFFSDIIFKEEIGSLMPFERMVVKVKKEIIRLDIPLDVKKTGKHISPEEFLDLYNKNEEITVLDARNNYESQIGKFKDAITPDIKTFREFPKVAEMLKDKKDKKIVMYCTGGIRCEKASAYLIEQGFKDVSQISGGIITFCQKLPETLWEGKCFVFDDRLISPVNQKQPLLEKCVACESSCDLYKNCRNAICNKRISICRDCKTKFNGCCSQACLEEFKLKCKEKEISNRKLSINVNA